MLYNRSTVTFSQWMDELKNVARDEYSFTLGYNFHEKEFYELYSQGMDVHEAIITHQEKAGV